MALPNPSMTFTPFDILTAEEMNDLVENITALYNGTAFDSNSIDAGFLLDSSIDQSKLDFSVAGGNMWELMARVEASTTQASLISPTFAVRKYLMVICIWIPTGGSNAANSRFNGDSGTNYAFRFSQNNGTETTSASTNTLSSGSADQDRVGISVMHIANLSGKEKYCYYQEVTGKALGAATPPDRYEIAGKWTNTAQQITQITRFASGNNLGAGSLLLILGKN